MTWEWIVFVAIAAAWSIAQYLIHAWKEVRMIQAMPEDMLRELREAEARK